MFFKKLKDCTKEEIEKAFKGDAITSCYTDELKDYYFNNNFIYNNEVITDVILDDELYKMCYDMFFDYLVFVEDDAEEYVVSIITFSTSKNKKKRDNKLCIILFHKQDIYKSIEIVVDNLLINNEIHSNVALSLNSFANLGNFRFVRCDINENKEV